MSKVGKIRIRELAQHSGLNRQTIHYYLREGLLHPPCEKSKNSALYDVTHIERLRLIRDLREAQFLPVKAIRAIIAGDKQLADFSSQQRETITEFQQSLRGRQQERQLSHSLGDVSKKARFSQPEIKQLKKLQWITPEKRGDEEMLNDQQAELLTAWAGVRDAGLTPKRGFGPQDFTLFDNLLGELAEQTATLIKDRLGNLDAGKLETIYDRLVPALQKALGQTHALKLEQALAKL